LEKVVVIRFPCSHCGKVLSLPERKAGRNITCPVCQGRCVVPEPGDHSAGTPPPAALIPTESAGQKQAPGPLSRMSLGVRLAVAAVVATGVLGMALAIARPPLPGGHGAFDARWGLLMAGFAFAVFAVILHGQLTSCPSCRRWWSRVKVESEFLEREVFEKNGVPCARSLFRTTYACDSCRHRWSVTEADEYPAPAALGRDRAGTGRGLGRRAHRD
jgi:hypothetical protein